MPVVTISSKNLLEPLRVATGWVWVADAKTMCFDLSKGIQEDFRPNPANSDAK